MQTQSDRKRSILINSGIFCFLILSGLTALVLTTSKALAVFDDTIIKVIVNHDTWQRFWFQYLTQLGSTISIILVTILLFSCLFGHHRSLAWFSLITPLLTLITNFLIKNLIQRPRPTAKHLVHVTGFSFPSGHAAGTMVLASVCVILLFQLAPRHDSKWLLELLIGLFPIFIGITRIYLHVHYPSDVLAGWLEGLGISLISWSFWLKKDRKISKKNNTG